MRAGNEVFYRLSEENVQDIHFRRTLMANDKYDTYDIHQGELVPTPSHQIFTGPDVEIGEVFPALIIRAYSVFDRTTEDDEPDREYAKLVFSGVADLKVFIPGSETLWVPLAEEDLDGVPVERQLGASPNAKLVALGKFTRIQPPSLL